MTEAATPTTASTSTSTSPVDDTDSHVHPHPVATSSAEKKLLVKRAFLRLPDEIIQQILEIADPNSFASLILLNRDWRRVSQQVHLYALHLAECPSYAASHKNALSEDAYKQEDLSRLRRLFAREVKRNLFEAYLRPKETVIKLVSNSISSSSAPVGEGLQFSPSPRGHHLLAYNSSRIYVIDVRPADIDVKRELGILRRPVSTCINDDGSVLAVLSTEMQVDIYDLALTPPKRTQSIILDHTPRTIAMSPCASVIAAAYEGGIEVSSLNPGALATDRRAVKCDGVDALAFSFDGTQILGTTVQSSPPSTVILTAPYYDPGNQLADDNKSALWTTSILFPNTSRDCSHAVLLQNSTHEEACWTFTYDRSFETFRAVRIDDLRNGTTYFTGPVPNPDMQAKLIPCTLPAATFHGELVSAGFQGKDIWLYGVPEDLDAVPDSGSSTTETSSANSGLSRRNSAPSRSASTRLPESSQGRVPQWQVLCDKLRNTFVWGCKVSELEGVSTVKWVANFGTASTKERLVIAAKGVSPAKPVTEEDDIDFVDGGRVTLLDFDYGFDDGSKTEITIEVGHKTAEVLEEEQRDMETEVAIVRRRTVAQRGGHRTALLRAATTATRSNPAPHMPAVPPMPRLDATDNDDDPLLPRRMGVPTATITPASPSDDVETESIIEEQEALDAPYAHASPRSGTTLRRAATAAAANRRLNPQNATPHVEYRRADGRAEHPHESDADNWVPPPPPYQKEDPGDLPAFLRHPAVALGSVSVPDHGPSAAPATQQSQGAQQSTISAWPSMALQTAQPAEKPLPAQPTQPVPPTGHPVSTSHGRDVSDVPSASGSRRQSTVQRIPGPEYIDADDLYDVSPPESPRLGPTNPAPSARVVSQMSFTGVAATDPVTPQKVQPASSLTTPSTASTNRSAASFAQRAANLSPQTDRMPALNLQIPTPTVAAFDFASSSSNTGNVVPGVRRLSNSQTWPTQPKPPSQAQGGLGTGYPHTAPATGATAEDMLGGSLPPPPRPDQLASLNNRVDRGSPHRLSGGFQVPRVPVGSRAGSRASGDYTNRRYHTSLADEQPPAQYTILGPQRLTMQQPPPPPEEQPLIISTPTGVSGAYDSPLRQPSGRGRVEMPLHQPVARHPSQTRAPTALRPTVERLETIYSVASHATASTTGQQQQSRGGILPSWLTRGNSGGAEASAATSSSGTGANRSKLNRKQSRAERSAAKNMQDARRQGYAGKNNKKKKKSKKNVDYEVASSAAWTDVSRSDADGGTGEAPPKDKKCAVM